VVHLCYRGWHQPPLRRYAECCGSDTGAGGLRRLRLPQPVRQRQRV